nr:DNA-directed DNA polymerase [Tanacetum cinerariifolium]
MADNRTMAKLLKAPTEGYEDAIVIPEITAKNFELKHGLINLVQNKQIFGHDKEDPHAHIRYLNKITSTMRVPNVPSSSIKLILFPFSLEGAARIWLEKEPPRSILTWDDLVTKFINQACPHHGFSELHQLDTFYNALNVNDQDSLNSAAVVAKVSTSSSTPAISYEVAELKDMVRASLLDKKNQSSAPALSFTPAPVKAVEPNCVTCGGSGTLPSNTITNPKEDLKGITTRSGVAYQGPIISTPSKVVKQGTDVTKDQVQTPISQRESSHCQYKFPLPVEGVPTARRMEIPLPGEDPPPEVPMADNQTMAKLLQAPTEGYEDAIVIPEITANNFQLKHGLINLVQNKQIFKHDKEDPHAHIRYLNKITSTMRVPNFFPPSKTTNLHNEITRFQQRFDESFYEAWDRFIDLLRACPHHGFSELHQLDTFYNALNSKSKVHQSRAKAVVVKVSTSSSTPAISYEVDELKDMVRASLLDKKNQSSAPALSSTPAPVKAVEPNCVTCGGSGTLPSNTITNPKEDLKGITTRSGVAYQGSTISTPSKVVKQGTDVTKDQVQTPISQSTAPIQPPVAQSETQTAVFEPVVAPVSASMPNVKSSITYPSRRNNERRPLSLPELTPTCMTLELVDRSVSKPIGITKDVSFKVGMFHFPADFVVVDFNPDLRVPLILGRCFLKTGRALIDVHKGELTILIGNEAITYNLDQTVKYSAKYNQITANKIDVIEIACEDDFILFEEADALLGLEDDSNSPKINPFYYDPERDILLLKAILNTKTVKSSIDEPPEVELKDLPPHIEYAFLEGDNKLPVIIAKELGDEKKSALIKVLKSHKRAITWKLSDIQGINPEFCTHKILMKEDYKPAVQHQRRVNPKIHNVIKKEVEKLLDAGLIYPISDSPWVSPVHCVPKKGGFTVVENEENELIPTRSITGWRGTNTIVSSMVSLGISKFPLTRVIRRKPHSPGHMGRSPTVACLSVYAMHWARFKGVCWLSFTTWLRRRWKSLWTTSRSLEILLKTASLA